MGWNRFFHGRFGRKGFTLIGWMRVAYSMLFILDRIFSSYDYDYLLHPTHGVANFQVARQSPWYNENMRTLFELFPESESFIWTLHYIGLIQGVLLLLGIAPKFQAFCIFINMVSFQHHNQFIWDAEDVMFKIWLFLFFLLPLHHVTIFDRFGFKKPILHHSHDDLTWSMWPVRLFQLEMTIIYAGAFFSKLQSKSWRDGTAMYWITYTSDFYPGTVNPDFLFNRLLPLKLFTWSALVLEGLGFTLVWVDKLRFAVVLAMYALHVGIDLTMNMYAFEWLAIIGWTFFLIQPENGLKNDAQKTPVVEGPTRGQRWLGNVVLVGLLSLFAIDSFPTWYIAEVAPQSLQPALYFLHNKRLDMLDMVDPYLHRFGIKQQQWNMYAGDYPDYTNCFISAELFFPASHRVEVVHTKHWLNMTWVERKMRTRYMNFYSSIEGNHAAAAWVQMAKNMWYDFSLDDDEDDDGNSEAYLSQVRLSQMCEYGVDYPQDVGWFEPVRQPYMEYTKHLVNLRDCRDEFDDCEIWADNGACQANPKYMRRFCKWSCEICDDFLLIWPDRETAQYYEPKDNNIYLERIGRQQ